MATQITAGLPHGDSLSGSPEKRLDVDTSGALWACLTSVGKLIYFRSTNGGSSWAPSAGSDLSLGSGVDTAVPSFFIDADGYAHTCFVRWEASPQVVIYARGTPVTGGGWSWKQQVISPAAGRTGVDSDIVVFRNGTGWVAWVSYDLNANGGCKVAKVDISSNGTLSVGATSHGPTLANAINQYGSLEFKHTGDGKTPTASPDLYLVVASISGTAPLYAHRAAYSGGVWTWQTPVNITASVEIGKTTMCTVFDGTRLMVAWAGTGATAISVSEWDTASTVTARNPPAMPGGTGVILGVSLSCDPSTGDIYLAAYGATIGNIVYCKFTRATTTWGSWTTVQTRTAYSGDGDVQMVRHPPRDSIDLLYSTGSGPYTIFSAHVTDLTRSPNSPSLISPANGATSDLASGGVFTWQYNPVSPSDSQQAWAFRRVNGATTQYWNASTQAFATGSIIWNTTDPTNPTQVAFPAGKWTTGTTYTWSVATKSATGAASSFASDRTITAAVVPAVVVTSPSGIAYGESTPLVVWTYTSPNAQRDYQVRIVPTFGVTIDPNNPGPATWDSGVVGSSLARSARVGTALTNGTAYRAYVRCSDSTGLQSTWSYSDFAVSIVPPTGPLVEVLDEVFYDTDVPRVRLDLTARSNYLDANQTNGQANWVVDANCTLAAQPDDSANQLIASLQMTSAAAGNMIARTSVGTPPAAPFGQPALSGPLSFPVVAGQRYTAVASFKSAVSIRACRVSIRWYDDDDGTGVLISESPGDQVTSSLTSYVPAFVTDEAPAGAKLGRMVVTVLATAGASEVHYAGRMSFHPGDDTNYQSGGYANTQTLRVERSDDGGVTWTGVVDRIKPDYWQKVTTTDRLMPFNTEVRYRCFTDVDLGDGSTLTSGTSPVSFITIDSQAWVIRDPDTETAEVNALVIGFTRNDEETIAITRPVGRFYPVVDSEGLQSGKGKISIYVRQRDVADTVALLQRAVPMVIQNLIGEVIWVRFPAREYTPQDMISRTIDLDYYEIESGA
jgi:hypothetical protein